MASTIPSKFSVILTDPDDACPECGSGKREFPRSHRGDNNEPPCSDTELCFDCGHVFEEEDEATKRGI